MWCAALLLSAWLLNNPDIVRGLDVLELGSGLGLSGIAAGYLAKSVTLTGCSRVAVYLRLFDSSEGTSFMLVVQRKKRRIAKKKNVSMHYFTPP